MFIPLYLLDSKQLCTLPLLELSMEMKRFPDFGYFCLAGKFSIYHIYQIVEQSWPCQKPLWELRGSWEISNLLIGKRVVLSITITYCVCLKLFTLRLLGALPTLHPLILSGNYDYQHLLVRMQEHAGNTRAQIMKFIVDSFVDFPTKMADKEIWKEIV